MLLVHCKTSCEEVKNDGRGVSGCHDNKTPADSSLSVLLRLKDKSIQRLNSETQLQSE